MIQASTGLRWDAWGILAIVVIGGLLALSGAAQAIDAPFAMQMWTLVVAFVCGAAALTFVWSKDETPQASQYENGVIKAGVIASMFWGIAGLLVGLIIALQLAFPSIFYFPDFGWLNFGRLRPLHTSAVIFAFGGNVLIATSFYVVQRTCRARLAGGLWPWFVFWGYQLFIVLAGTGYL